MFPLGLSLGWGWVQSSDVPHLHKLDVLGAPRRRKAGDARDAGLVHPQHALEEVHHVAQNLRATLRKSHGPESFL